MYEVDRAGMVHWIFSDPRRLFSRWTAATYLHCTYLYSALYTNKMCKMSWRLDSYKRTTIHCVFPESGAQHNVYVAVNVVERNVQWSISTECSAHSRALKVLIQSTFKSTF